MAVTFSFNWGSSPRVIIVNLPDTVVTVQQLVDGIRFEEAQDLNLTYDHLIDTVGKSNLGGGLLTGIVLTLQNAQIQFANQPGPTLVQCFINGGTVVESDGSNPILPSTYTVVTLNNTVGGVIANNATSQQIATSVWAQSKSSPTSGSYGDVINKIKTDTGIIVPLVL